MTRWLTTTLVAGLLLVVGFVLPLLIVLHSVGYWDPDPSAERSEDTGSPTTLTTSTTVAAVGSAPGEGAWEALPSHREVEVEVWAAALSAIPTTTVPEPQPPVRTPAAPAPAPPPPVQAGGTIEALICSYGWGCQTALRVFSCESGLNPAAVSPGGDLGIAQVNPIHRGRWEAMGYTRADMLTPGPNLAVAWSIWSEVGWSAWACAR